MLCLRPASGMPCPARGESARASRWAALLRAATTAYMHGSTAGAAAGASVPPSRPNRAPGGRDGSGRYRCFTKVSAGMDDEPREQISELEVQIEELTDALERCRKTALATKAAMGLGGILMAATTLGVVTFDPMMMVAGLAALLGGVVVFGSNTSTANQLSESMRSAEAQRAALIGGLNICLVEDAPANRDS